MKEKFKSTNFRQDSLTLIDHCNAIINIYLQGGLRLTLRQLYYQLVTRNIIPNVERSYKNLSNLVSDGRLTGLIDWDAIEDRIRVPVIPTEFEDLRQLVDAALYSYRLPRWATQDNYVELWVEKDALAGVLRPLAHRYHVPMMVNRGYCVNPDVKILTADLKWIAANEVKPGLQVLGVDENVPGYKKHRRLRLATVETVTSFISPRVKVTTDRGSIIVSDNHPFLATPHAEWRGYKWIKAENLKPGAQIAFLAAPWNEDRSWEAGWLAGLYDGEGHLPSTKLTREIAVCQKQGVVANLIRERLKDRGFVIGESLSKQSYVITFRNYTAGGALKILGQLRPERLLLNFQKQLKCGRWPAKGKKEPAIVRSIEHLSPGEVIGIETTTKTIITDGYVSHNSSQSAMYEASKRFINQSKMNKVILYLGDFDPSGEDMVRDIGDRMDLFECGHNFYIKKIALNPDQIQKYNPPPNPAKHTDPRSKDFIAKYGASSWEVDAIEPSELQKIIVSEVEALIDRDAMEIIKQKENEDKIKLTKAVKKIMEGDSD